MMLLILGVGILNLLISSYILLELANLGKEMPQPPKPGKSEPINNASLLRGKQLNANPYEQLDSNSKVVDLIEERVKRRGK